MKQHFERKSFQEELDLWAYLQSLKDKALDVQDGHYVGEFIEDKVGQLNFRCIMKFTVRETLIDMIYYRPLDNPRFYIHVKDGKVFCVGIDSVYLTAHEEIKAHGRWELVHYFDLVLESQKEKPKFTQEEYAKCMDSLVELLVVNSKKVA